MSFTDLPHFKLGQGRIFWCVFHWGCNHKRGRKKVQHSNQIQIKIKINVTIELFLGVFGSFTQWPFQPGSLPVLFLFFLVFVFLLLARQ